MAGSGDFEVRAVGPDNDAVRDAGKRSLVSPRPVCVVCRKRSPAAHACSGPWQETRKGPLLNANRPVRRMLLALSAAGFVIGAVVCASLLLYTNPHGVPRVAAGLLVGLLIVGVAAHEYLKRRVSSNSLESSRLASPLQPSYVPLRQTSGDYWYPAAATRDRAGTRLRERGRDRDVAHIETVFECRASLDSSCPGPRQRDVQMRQQEDGNGE